MPSLMLGSSPRMRGTPFVRPACRYIPWIIPAYAGNTNPHKTVHDCERDHPRVCGEHLPTASVFHPLTGSSPRMRGTPGCGAAALRQGGIIPAYAGNTQRAAFGPLVVRDHPRVCGEHYWRMTSPRAPRGSSPRMRGTHVGLPAKADPAGIIPAYAGNTDGSVTLIGGVGDHPRVCGEHTTSTSSKTKTSGSSPRMRGTPTLFDGSSENGGIIPAYAGNTLRD